MISRITTASVLTIGLAGCAGQRAHQSITPERVAAEVNGADLEGVRKVWYKLGAERPGIPGRRPEVFMPAGRPVAYAAGPFAADVFRVDLDGSADGMNGTSDALVRIRDGAAWDWQFLAFLSSPSGWTYAGCIDLPNNRVGTPAPDVRTLGPNLSWLTLQVSNHATSGKDQEELAWHQLRNGRIVEVLRTPVKGHRIGGTATFDVVYRAEVLDLFLTRDNRAAVTVNIEAVYSNARRDAFPHLTELFRRAGVVRYVQDAATGRFVIDPRVGSDWSAEELAGLLTDSADQFVHNNRVQLVELAHSGDPTRRQWVARLRQDCASPEVRQELAALVTADAGG